MIVISSSCSITTIPNPLIPTACSYSLIINRCRKWCHTHPCHLQAMINKFTFLSSHTPYKTTIIITITTTITLSTPKPIYILDQLSIASTLNTQSSFRCISSLPLMIRTDDRTFHHDTDLTYLSPFTHITPTIIHRFDCLIEAELLAPFPTFQSTTSERSLLPTCGGDTFL